MILTNVLIMENLDNYRPEEYISVVSELTPLECKILFTVYNAFQKVERKSENNVLQHSIQVPWKDAIIRECGVDEADINSIMKRLERTGFVQEITGAYLSYGGGQYKLSESMEKFIEYLSRNPLY